MSRKTHFDQKSMEAAISEVKSAKASIRVAAKRYNVPKSTLGDRVSGRIAMGATDGKAPNMSAVDETHLIEEAQSRAERGLGFTKHNFLRYAGAYAAVNGMPFKNSIPTDKWWRLFQRRHPIATLRVPESTAAVRHQCMEPARVAAYFSVLSDTLQANELANKSSCVWNMDETGVQLAATPDKIVARKGSKYLHAKAGSKEMVTVVAGGNADGTYLPLHFILKCKTKNALKSWDPENAPEGSQMSVSPNGWTKQGLALLWFEQVFIPSIGVHRPQLLIVDGHDSHHHVELLQAARENNIILMEMPAHCSNWLQPMDRTVFGPLKSNWKRAVNTLITATGYPVRHSNFFRLFSQAWSPIKADPSKLVNGFRATGIYPICPSAIPDAAYEPSRAYRRSEDSAPSNPPVAPSPVRQDTSRTSAAGAGQDRVIQETMQVHQPQFIAHSNRPVAPSPVWQDTSSTSAAGAGHERVLQDTIHMHQPQFITPSNPPVAPSPVWQDTSSTSAAGAGQERVLHETILVHQPQFIAHSNPTVAPSPVWQDTSSTSAAGAGQERVLQETIQVHQPQFNESQNAAVPVPIQPTTQYDHHLTRQGPVWSIDIPLVDESIETTSCLDLGISVTPDGDFVSANPETAHTDRAYTCPPRMAVAAIESSLSSDVLRIYKTAITLGIDRPADSTFQTWRMHVEKMNPDAHLLTRPDLVLPPKKPNSKKGFFVMTCDEAYAHKVNAKKRKEDLMRIKEERKQKKLQKKTKK